MRVWVVPIQPAGPCKAIQSEANEDYIYRPAEMPVIFHEYQSPRNGDEKRETPWIEFLHAKITDPTISSERRARIEKWMQCNALAEVRQLDVQALNTEMDRAVQAFDTAVSNLRNTRHQTMPRIPAPITGWNAS